MLDRSIRVHDETQEDRYNREREQRSVIHKIQNDENAAMTRLMTSKSSFPATRANVAKVSGGDGDVEDRQQSSSLMDKSEEYLLGGTNLDCCTKMAVQRRNHDGSGVLSCLDGRVDHLDKTCISDVGLVGSGTVPDQTTDKNTLLLAKLRGSVDVGGGRGQVCCDGNYGGRRSGGRRVTTIAPVPFPTMRSLRLN